MASALPLAEVAAWRVYLDLPMHGRRQLPGGLEEFMALGYQDAVLKAFEPQVTQAVKEFPAAQVGQHVVAIRVASCDQAGPPPRCHLADPPAQRALAECGPAKLGPQPGDGPGLGLAQQSADTLVKAGAA